MGRAAAPAKPQLARILKDGLADPKGSFDEEEIPWDCDDCHEYFYSRSRADLAIAALGNLGRQSQDLVPSLVEALAHFSTSAGMALLAIGGNQVNLLLKGAAHPNAAVRLGTLNSILSFSYEPPNPEIKAALLADPNLRSSLEALSRDSDDSVKETAAAILQDFASRQTPAKTNTLILHE